MSDIRKICIIGPSMVHSFYYLGSKEKPLAIAWNLDDETIAEKTGLSVEEIGRLRTE